MPHGYSQYTVSANKAANGRLLGVALGRLCIARGVPASEVASKFGVSRQTVYNWFGGKHSPQDTLTAHILKYIHAMSK